MDALSWELRSRLERVRQSPVWLAVKDVGSAVLDVAVKVMVRFAALVVLPWVGVGLVAVAWWWQPTLVTCTVLGAVASWALMRRGGAALRLQLDAMQAKHDMWVKADQRADLDQVGPVTADQPALAVEEADDGLKAVRS